jgi:hypothetical protein
MFQKLLFVLPYVQFFVNLSLFTQQSRNFPRDYGYTFQASRQIWVWIQMLYPIQLGYNIYNIYTYYCYYHKVRIVYTIHCVNTQNEFIQKSYLGSSCDSSWIHYGKNLLKVHHSASTVKFTCSSESHSPGGWLRP